MKKRFISTLLLSAIMLIGCGSNITFDPVNKYAINTENNRFDFDGNFVKPELTIDGLDLEDEWHGKDVSETLHIKNEDTAEVDAKIYRGKEAIFFFFNVKDKYINSKGSYGDDVSLSDSIEIYIDGNNDGGRYPNEDDYQINLGVNGRSRILVGSGRYWQTWNGLCQFEVKLNGTLNDNSDIDIGYSIEVLLPWSQINCSKDSTIGIAFGNVDKNTSEDKEKPTWGGIVFDGLLVEPQRPENYITYSGTTFYSRGERIEPSVVEGFVYDVNNNPIGDAKVSIGDDSVLTDSNGKYVINNIYSKENLSIAVTKNGYTQLCSQLYASLFRHGNGVINKDFYIKAGGGSEDEEIDYNYIGETVPKVVEEIQFPTSKLYISRINSNGLLLSILNSDNFKSSEQYELYIDTRQSINEEIYPDKHTYLLSFRDQKIVKFTNNPKSDVYCQDLVYSKVDVSISDNEAYIFIPYTVLGITKENVIRVAYGVFNEQASDWSPLSRFGQEIIVEDVSTYFTIDSNGRVTNGPKVADYYNHSLDTHNYVSLGTFAGKFSRGVQFSTISVGVDHTQQDALYILFNTNFFKWNDSEKIELFIDVGSPDRSSRDEYTYQIIIHCNQGALLSFINYGDVTHQLSTDELNDYMDKTYLQIKIPYEVIGTTFSSDIGFTFGLFNLIADDWDGYGYGDVYRDPAIPLLYVRVDNNNQIK